MYVISAVWTLSVLCCVVQGQNVPPDSRACKIDLAVLVDISGSIVGDKQYDLGQDFTLDQEIMKNWYAVTNFTYSLIQKLDIGEGKTHVGVVTFADRVREIFNLAEYNKNVMLDKVRQLTTVIPYGNTNAFGALTKSRDEIFSISGIGNRPDVEDVIIMITDGAPSPEYGGPAQILQQAASLKSRGFTILAVGVTDKVNMTLLQTMVTDRDKHYFPVENFQGLENQLESIINKTCDNRPVETFSVDCNVDLAFVIDSSGSVSDNSLERNWDQVIDFTLRVARSFTWNVSRESQLPRIAALTYSNIARIEFNLNDYKSQEDYLKALSAIRFTGGNTNTTGALRMAYEQIFASGGGDRVGVQNVIVLITDGLANIEQDTLMQTAQQIQSMGVHIIVVYMNQVSPPTQYLSLSNNPPRDFFPVRAYNQMSSVYQNVTTQTCVRFSSNACNSKVDVFFVMDASGSINEKNFKSMKTFVATVIEDLVTDMDTVRVGLITFSTSVQPIFQLNTYTNKSEMLSAVLSVPYARGRTNTAAAISYLRNSGFTRSNGDRDNIQNIAVILTDGNSNDKTQTLEEAYHARRAGIHFMTVGIGDWTNVFELQSVASYPYEENYFPIMTFDQLDNALRSQLKRVICNDKSSCLSNPCQCGGSCVNYQGGYLCECPQGCAGVNCELTCKEPKDVVIAVDASGSVGEPNFRRELDFVREIVLGLNFNQGTQLGLLRYATNTDVRFHLNDFGSGSQTKLQILNAVSLYFSGGSTNTAEALRVIHNTMFTPQHGDQAGRKNVGLVMTDGRSTDFAKTWEQARLARGKGIELLALAIGGSVNYLELQGIATGPDRRNVYNATGFNTLKAVTGDIINAICNNINECGNDYCKNGGTPLDLMNRCECQCPPSTSGHDCSRRCTNKYDIILVIDASGSIRNERFRQVLEFIIEVISEFQIGQDMARIGAISFSDTPRVEFQLNSYNREQDVVSAIRNIRFMAGKTNIADALEIVQQQMFTSGNGDRSGVENYVLIFTDGKPNIKEGATMTAAINLRANAGVKVSALGIGEDANSMELRAMASEPVNKMAVIAPSFTDLLFNKVMRRKILTDMVTSTCDDVNECLSNPCDNGGQCVDDLHQYSCQCRFDWTGRNCQRRCTNQMDVVFILDFSGSVDQVFNVIVAFAKSVIYGLPVAFGRARVGVVTYEDTSQVAFHLNQYNTKEEILNAMSLRRKAGGTTNTQEAMIKMYNDMFSSQYGDRAGVPNIAVLVTDGGSNVQKFNTIPSAVQARNRGIEIFIAAVGESPDYGEINAMATDPDSDHVISVTDSSSIETSANNLLDRLCQ